MNTPPERLRKLSEIAHDDGRYKLEAYLFVIESLNHQMRRLGLTSSGKRRHLTARELLEGIRTLGWDRFGRLAGNVFEHWGVSTTRDFGEIVFKLIEAGEFTKTDEDRIEDFDHVFDFDRDLTQNYPMGQKDDG